MCRCASSRPALAGQACIVVLLLQRKDADYCGVGAAAGGAG